MRIDEQVHIFFFMLKLKKKTVHWEFMKGGGLMMTITLWNQNNWLMVIRDEKAITWTVGKHWGGHLCWTTKMILSCEFYNQNVNIFLKMFFQHRCFMTETVWMLKPGLNIYADLSFWQTGDCFSDLNYERFWQSDCVRFQTEGQPSFCI